MGPFGKSLQPVENHFIFYSLFQPAKNTAFLKVLDARENGHDKDKKQFMNRHYLEAR